MYNCRPAHPDVGPHAGRVGDTQGQGRHKQAGSILYSLEICYVKRSRVQTRHLCDSDTEGRQRKKKSFRLYKLQITLQIANCKLHFTNYKLQITNYKLQIANYKLQITNYKLQITNFTTANKIVLFLYFGVFVLLNDNCII